MSAELLRKAATILRERAEAATPGPWERFGMAGVSAPDWEVVDERRIKCDGCDEDVALLGCATNDDALYIATMDPDVGLALKALLENLAVDMENFDLDGTTGDVADYLARLIVGEQS